MIPFPWRLPTPDIATPEPEPAGCGAGFWIFLTFFV